ncbi:MAG: hypothetical protein CVU90_03870 [Firmicutes bacterium HGW-Firmicutes-15]|nr:MAG: hypothetical protein CVU90_03870 [Firmicutes bacterium HGW-Firmicutes-15]
MTSLNKKPTTYRLSPELDQLIINHAKKLGISKNAFVQMTLMQVLDANKAKPDNRLDSDPSYLLHMNT